MQTNPSDFYRSVALDYIEICFELEKHFPGLVDAYFGPEAIRLRIEEGEKVPPVTVSARIDSLESQLAADIIDEDRTDFLLMQFTALKTIARMINGETFGFLEETAFLYDIQPVKVPESRYKEALDMIDKALPGTGPLAARLEGFRKQLTILQDKVFELFSKAAEIARNKVQSILPMPGSETFDPELVNDKPWSGYNWFKGKSHSLIQLNVDLPRRVDQLIPLMTHEGYPGHHTELTMREKLLYQDKGYLEYSIYPLYSPMSAISEGYSDLGAEILFSDKETVDFIKDVLSNELHVYDFDFEKWNILRSALSDLRSVWGERCHSAA